MGLSYSLAKCNGFDEALRGWNCTNMLQVKTEMLLRPASTQTMSEILIMPGCGFTPMISLSTQQSSSAHAAIQPKGT